MKKQILDDMSKCTNKGQAKCQGKDTLVISKTVNSITGTNDTRRKRKMSESRDADETAPVVKIKVLSSDTDFSDKEYQDQNLSTSYQENIKEKEELKLSKEELDHKGVDKSLTSQFDYL